jgi:tyrosinase
MSETGEDLRVRRSLLDLQDAYEAGEKKPLDDLMRAWKGIKELSPQELPSREPRSFFVLGGYHGEPFRGAGWGNSTFWGGYCHHGNVLFPVWHRIYLYELEEALRSIPGCEDVTMPFWDECSEDSLLHGIPWALTAETFELDDETIPNPLRSYVFPLSVVDHIGTDEDLYSKQAGYETVRYPYSGLVGTEAARKKTKAHNERWTYPQSVERLNENIVGWLGESVEINKKVVKTGVHQDFLDCLEAPNYTVFSNTTSAENWEDNAPRVVPLESPHNKIHLAVGGFDVPGQEDYSVIPDANGDMGENDTAALDPIFYFHHCFIDRVFWLWQKRHGATDELPIIAEYPGTNSTDNQGATPGIPPNAWLSMDTPLEPFTYERDGVLHNYVGRDAFNIETQLGYTYGPGSLEYLAATKLTTPDDDAPVEPEVHVSGINRGTIRGSFLITAFANVDGERKPIGSEAVLSRWHVQGCANCQTHLMATASFPLHGLDPDTLADTIEVEVRTRDGLLGGQPQRLSFAAGEARAPLRVQIRDKAR